MIGAASLYDLGDRVALRRRFLTSSIGRSFRPERPCGHFLACDCNDEASGVTLLSRERLRLLVTEENRRALDDIIDKCAAGWPWPDAGDYLQPEQVLERERGVYMLGLDPGILALVESYLEEPCLYLGPCLKREAVTPHLQGTRQWHTDVEDDRMVRLLIYLSPVAQDCGPFQYLPTEDTTKVREATGYKSGYRSDDWLKRVAPSAEPRCCTGAPGTAVLFDGSHVMHRAGRPERAERLSVTFTYLTRHPLQLYGTARLSRSARAALCASLSEREQACIPASRWF